MAELFDGGLAWLCGACGGGAPDETALLEHQEWCLGDAEANTVMLAQVAAQNGSLEHDQLVAAAREHRRRAGPRSNLN